MTSEQRKIYKITILGDGGVGKTSLRKIYLGSDYSRGFSQIIGANFTTILIKFESVDSVAQIWDLAKHQRFSAVREVFYRGTSGCLLVFDITKRSTFENISSWIAELLKNNSQRLVPMILVGNKCDIIDTAKDQIMFEEPEKYSKNLSSWAGFSIPYFETSAKTGENINEPFETLFRNIADFDGGKGGLAPTPIVPGDYSDDSATLSRSLKDSKNL